MRILRALVILAITLLQIQNATHPVRNPCTAGARQPEFLQTHPNPENRLERIREMIDRLPERGEG